MPHDDLPRILAEATAIAAVPPREAEVPADGRAAATVAEAHFRAECEGRPVTCGTATVYPIGARPVRIPARAAAPR